jgi:hypothetical protein
MNPASVNIGVLDYAKRGTLFIQNDFIYVPQHTSPTQVRTFSTLPVWFKTTVSLMMANKQVEKARSLAVRFAKFRFCLGRLIPYLRFIDREAVHPPARERDLRSELDNLAQRALALREQYRPQAAEAIPPAILREIFDVPCALTLGLVIPLEPVSNEMTVEPHDVFINAARYRPRPDKAKSLSDVMGQIQQMIDQSVAGELSDRGSCEDSASAFLCDIESLVNSLEPDNVGCFRIIFKSESFQLHYCRGQFVLVHGPLHHRDTQHQFYIGLNLTERRQQWLRTPPFVCKNSRDVWTLNGLPQPGNVCMGNSKQYDRILSCGLSDEEALIEYLAACVAISTRTSIFFDKWRQNKLKRNQPRRPALRR